jgi:hypothetical protein
VPELRLQILSSVSAGKGGFVPEFGLRMLFFLANHVLQVILIIRPYIVRDTVTELHQTQITIFMIIL